MKSQLVALAFVVVFMGFASLGEASVFDTIKICGRLCSDGSTYTQCVDTYGSASFGDCHEAVHCPPPLQDSGWSYDLGEDENLRFSEMEPCQNTLNRMMKDPNLPVIVEAEYKPVEIRRALSKEEQAIRDAMEWHHDFSLYSKEEQLSLGQRILAGNKRTRDMIVTEEETREIGRRMFEFVASVRAYTNRSGVYTNSKCAGCSLIVQSIQNKLTSSVCSSISGVVKSTICAATTPVLQSFCNILMDAVEFETLVSTLCENAFSSAIQATNLRERANLLCSSLTCTNQPDVIQSENDITGQCKQVTVGSSERSLNERCDELIAICDMAEKGFCVAGTIKELNEQTSSFVDCAIDTVASLVLGQTPPVAESVQKLATECMEATCGGGGGDGPNMSSAVMATPIALLLLLSLFLQ